MIHEKLNKTIVRAFVDAINAKDWKAMETLVAPGFIRHSHAAGRPGVGSREDLVAYFRNEYETFPDAHETIEDLLAEGSKVVARHRFKGTQRGPLGPYPPTGRTMTAEYIAIYRVERSQIVEAWAEWDNLSGLRQLGHYREPCEPVTPREG